MAATIGHEQVIIVLMTFGNHSLGRNLWGTCTVSNRHREIRFHAEFIPKSFLHKRLKRLGTTFYNQRLDTMRMETVEVQRVLMVNDEAFGVRTTPLPDIQLRMVEDGLAYL